MKSNWLKRNTAGLLILVLALLHPLSLLTVQAAIPAETQAVQAYDSGWKKAENGQWNYVKNGAALKSVWICDKSSGSRWYALDENGAMVEGPLILEAKTGKYYLLNNTTHDGTFGSVITTNGTYYGINLQFHQDHDGSFGALDDAAQIRALIGKLGVRTVTLESTVDVGVIKYSSAGGGSSSGSGSDTAVPYTKIYTISYNFDGGDDYYENPRGYTKVSENITLVDPEREGYTFLGWTNGNSRTQQPVKSVVIPKGSTGNRSFKAHWEETKLTVTVKVNNAQRGSVDITEVEDVPYGTEIIADGADLYIGDTKVTATASPVATPSTAATPSSASRSYTFHDWTAPLSVTEDVTVTANFTNGTDLCTVTAKDDLGEFPEVTTTVVKGTAYDAMALFNKDGYLAIRATDQTGADYMPSLNPIVRDTVLTVHIVKDLFDEFEELEHVKKVKRTVRAGQYYLYFEQPLDWNNLKNGTFIQKVQVVLENEESTNVLNTEGYVDSSASSLIVEPLYIVKGNYVSPEHRFFGHSVPTGLCTNCPTYWQYLTTENAAADTHRIRTEIGSVLTGKWIFTGTSKGGLTTNLQAYYHPEDADVWMPYVAPLCNGIEDSRFMEFLNETAGNDYYGEERAAEMRSYVMDIMCWCEENRDVIAPAVWDKKVTKGGLLMTKKATPEILMELCLMDYQANCWQSGLAGDPQFEDVKKLRDLLENPNVSMSTKKAKIVKAIATEGGYETTSWAYPYYIQSLAELGQYHWNTEYLHEALEERGSDVETAIPADADGKYFRDLILTDALKKVIKYDRSTYEEMIDWIDDTDQKIMMIFGSCDPWTSVRIPVDEEKENIKVYIMPGACHNASLARDPQVKAEAVSILYDWLDLEQPE